MSNALGKLLRELRGSRSLRSVQNEANISHAYIRNLENGIDKRSGSPIKPSPEKLKVLASVYHCSYDELMKAAGYLGEQQQQQAMKQKLQAYKFHARLELLRNNKNLTIDELAEQIGITPEYLKHIDQDVDTLPEHNVMFRLAEAFQVTPDFLYGYTDDVNGTSPETPKPVVLEEVFKNPVMFEGELLSKEDADSLARLFMEQAAFAKKIRKQQSVINSDKETSRAK